MSWGKMDPDEIVYYHDRTPMFCDREGRPISLRRYSELHSDRDYTRVAETTIGGWWVSTVWLGMNHQFRPDGENEPIIFETMPFYKGDNLNALHPELRDLDQSMWRYSTEEQAIAGHDHACIEIRRLLANVAMADEVLAEAIERANQPEDSDA